MAKKHLEKLDRKNFSARFIKGLTSPFQQFMSHETSSGITLILVTLWAMFWANSQWREIYEHIIHYPIGIQLGSLTVVHSLQHWVNDGLMVIFFYVVGMEIKKELLVGALSSRKKATLPVVAAIGGMVAPAVIYSFFNFGTPAQSGWAIPVATDIAFAVGVLVLLGKRVPTALKVFLLALAIADDLGAVVVIAAFYTETIHAIALGAAVLLAGLLFLFRHAGVRYPLAYFLLSIATWIAVLSSGVHATISGVVLGFLTPMWPLVPRKKLKDIVRPFENSEEDEDVDHLRQIYQHATSPLDRWTHVLHPWVNFAIMPLFAFVNAGVRIGDANLSQFFANPITLGIILGLVLGKPIGIVLFSWLTVKSGAGEMPQGVNWRQMWGMGCLAGIGFTMALFISHLSLKIPEVEVFSKLGILTASLISALVGSFLLMRNPAKRGSRGR